MRRLLKTSAVVLLLAVSALASYLAYYDLRFFKPALASTRQHMQSAPSLPTPPLLEQYLENAYGQTIEFHTAQVLLRQSAFGGGDGWRSFLWGKLADLHLSKHEQIAVVVALAHMGSNRYGFAAASQAIYAKPIDQLAPVELATLVALIKAPSYYESNPEMLVNRREQLLVKTGKHALQ